MPVLTHDYRTTEMRKFISSSIFKNPFYSNYELGPYWLTVTSILKSSRSEKMLTKAKSHKAATRS